MSLTTALSTGGSHPHTADEEMGCLSPPRSSPPAPASPSLSVTAESTPPSHFTPHPHLSQPGLIWGSLVWGDSWAGFQRKWHQLAGLFLLPDSANRVSWAGRQTTRQAKVQIKGHELLIILLFLKTYYLFIYFTMDPAFLFFFQQPPCPACGPTA